MTRRRLEEERVKHAFRFTSDDEGAGFERHLQRAERARGPDDAPTPGGGEGETRFFVSPATTKAPGSSVICSERSELEVRRG
jgi:hypothetical protein